MTANAVPGFVTFELDQAGLLFEADAIRVWALSSHQMSLDPNAAYWVLVTAGEMRVSFAGTNHTLSDGHYLAGPGPGTLHGGRGLVIEQRGYRNVRQLGGPLESRGRLRYVDGCSDTLLVCPPRLGQPCLNHLHIPPGTMQSEHTHASLRIGVIARGAGTCHTPFGHTQLLSGMGWMIPAGLRHNFSTREQSLDVFAWHPDSDFGPTDEDHPMINRTALQNR